MSLKRNILRLIADPFPEVELTPLERSVARLVARGMTYQEVAWELHVSMSTVKTAALRVGHKVGVNPRGWPNILISRIEVECRG